MRNSFLSDERHAEVWTFKLQTQSPLGTICRQDYNLKPGP